VCHEQGVIREAGKVRRNRFARGASNHVLLLRTKSRGS
jgi:hypothetical protein